MPRLELREFLDRKHVPYEVVNHPVAVTAQEVAAAAHVPGRQMAKTLIVCMDGRFAMVVLPATKRVDLEAVRRAAGAHYTHLAAEYEFRPMFPDCEVGAMAPFGNLYGLEVYMDRGLAGARTIAFNAGTHTELIRMSYRDYARLVHPTMLEA